MRASLLIGGFWQPGRISGAAVSGTYRSWLGMFPYVGL